MKPARPGGGCGTGQTGAGETDGRTLRIPDGPRHQPYPFAQLHPTDLLGAWFIGGLMFFALAAAAGLIEWLAPWGRGHWLALHLAFFGGISQLILGATQFFAGAFLATDPPGRRLVRGQLAGWNLGVLAVATGTAAGSAALTWVGAALFVAALAGWATALNDMRRRSLGRRPWATRWYLAAGGFLVFGILAGSLMATGVTWRHGSLLGTHLALNLGGWVGTVIVGTLHTFYPTLTRTRLRFARLEAPTFGLWCGGVAALALGCLLAARPLVVAGWALLAGSSILLAVNLAAARRAARPGLSLAGRTVGAAQPLLVAALLLLLVATLVDGPGLLPSGPAWRAAGMLLVPGWIGLTVAGSLLHLLVILLRARDRKRPVPAVRPRRDLAVAAVASLGVAGLAISRLIGAGGLPAAALIVLVLAAYAVLAARIANYGLALVREARPRI